MTINTFRQYLNDSRLGQMINHTTLGVIVEGASRKIYDLMDDAPYFARHISAKYLFLGDWQEIMIEDNYRGLRKLADESNPKVHYSLTSLLWRDYQTKGSETTFRVRATFQKALERVREKRK